MLIFCARSSTRAATRCAATGNDRNGNEAVAGVASETFARCLHHQYVSVKLLSAGSQRFAAR